MTLAAARELARAGRLYPSVILHGGNVEARQAAALELARTLQCAAPPAERPCGSCRHCRRIVWPGGEHESFHPDFHLLERDLKTSTSVDAVKRMLPAAQISPFEARGQVFVLAAAESLTGEAANALLKSLEEPYTTSPRHYLLLAPSQFDLLPTLRSRSLPIFLGPADALHEDEVTPLVAGFAASVAAYAETRAAIHLLAAAGALAQAEGWEDARSGHPWAVAAQAVLATSERLENPPPGLRRRLLALAEALLAAPELRLRGVTAERILEGLVARHLAADGGTAPRQPGPLG